MADGDKTKIEDPITVTVAKTLQSKTLIDLLKELKQKKFKKN